jgi:hypothetical protein
MKTYGEVDVYIHVFVTSALLGNEWSATRFVRFTHGGRKPTVPFGYQQESAPQSVWTTCPCRNTISDHSAAKPVASQLPTELYRFEVRILMWESMKVGAWAILRGAYGNLGSALYCKPILEWNCCNRNITCCLF